MTEVSRSGNLRPDLRHPRERATPAWRTSRPAEVNTALEGDPALVNRDPYGAGWMIKLRVKNAAELEQLLGSKAYQKHIGA